MAPSRVLGMISIEAAGMKVGADGDAALLVGGIDEAVEASGRRAAARCHRSMPTSA